MLLNFEDITEIRQKHPTAKIVFCSGTYDLTHAGHAIFFESCKKHGDILVVSVGSDQTIIDYKGDTRPILNERIRAYTIDSFKPVDYVYIDRPDAKKHPILVNEDVFTLVKPQVWVVNDDAFNIPYRQELAAKLGMEFVVEKKGNSLFPELSTSKIIEVIKNNSKIR